MVYLGVVVRAHATQGAIFVHVQNGFELEELHNVAISGLADGDIIVYEASTSLYKNKTTAALGLVKTDDARLTDSRIPTSHAASHGSAGSDAITISASQISDGSTTFARLGAVNAFTVGGHSITNAVASDVPLTLKSAAGQSANVMELKTSADIVQARITGAFGFTTVGLGMFGAVSGSLGQLTVFPGSTSTIGAVIRGLASQSANLQEWQTSTGALIAEVSPSVFRVGKNAAYPARFLVGASDLTSAISVNTHSTTEIGIAVRGVASQTANLIEAQDSTPTTVMYVSPAGSIYAPRLLLNGDLSGRLNVLTTATTQVAAVIRGMASQTGDLFQTQNSAGTLLTTVSAFGALSVRNGGVTSLNTVAVSAFVNTDRKSVV